MLPRVVLAIASLFLSATFAVAQNRPVVRVVYFVPTDRKPEPDHVARLDRVMTEVQRFYSEGMKQNGHGPLTFNLERDEKGALKIHEVAGKGAMKDYSRTSSGPVREEVKAALAGRGINVDREHIIIFQLLLEWKDKKAYELGAYVGGGDARAGTAWVYDDARLDPKLLDSKDPGGYYHGPCSLGKFNTHYIGGTIHELGHAFGLPHERERDQDRAKKGHSLMGSGNHTYGQNLRGEGPGTFLTPAAALPLSVHPLFTGVPFEDAPLKCKLAQLKATGDKGQLHLIGTLEGGPRVIGLVAYNDPKDIKGDYDAWAWTCPVDKEGKFDLTIEDLRPGEFDLRLRAVGANGQTKTIPLSYRVDAENRPVVDTLTK